MRSLTSRQREIVELRLQGWQHKQIAAKLCINLSTVKNHMSHVYERLDVPKVGFYHDKLRMAAAKVRRGI